MPTIRTLLDRYGQPPPELALDWAWQIRQRFDGRQTTERDCLLSDGSWTDLQVADDGLLDCDALDRETASLALQDLRHWSMHEISAQPSSVRLPDHIAESDESPTKVLTTNPTTNETITTEYERPARSPCAKKTLPKRVYRGLGRLSTKSWWLVGAGASVILLLSASLLLRPPAKPDTVAFTSSTAHTIDTNAVNDPSESAASSANGSRVEKLALIEPESQIVADGLNSSTSPTMIGELNVASSLGKEPALDEQVQPASIPDQTRGADKAIADASTSTASTNDSSSSHAPAPSQDTLREVNQTLTQAEAEESIVSANRRRGVLQDTHGDPWILSRDTMRYRVTLSPKLNVSARESQWTLALEPIAGLAVEPQRPITIGPRGLAVWRIYEADAKSPRACLMVRAHHRGRDGQLELVFCGGAEDMPGMSVPLAAQWLEPLTVRVQSQAIELRGALAQLSTTVILRDQVPAVMQRKQAMTAQMFTAARLGVIMPEINRLALLVDGQVTMHAALKSKPNEPAIATWGRLP